jgi:DNA replicative helicase MCM subunit Mcm2 (Cdc46/Mcm family)
MSYGLTQLDSCNGSGGCIDEFDKMRQTDRVVIHEQQTPSIASAEILNTRTAVLAP